MEERGELAHDPSNPQVFGAEIAPQVGRIILVADGEALELRSGEHEDDINNYLPVCLVTGLRQYSEFCACHRIPCAYVREDAIGEMHTTCYPATQVLVAVGIVFMLFVGLALLCVQLISRGTTLWR